MGRSIVFAHDPLEPPISSFGTPWVPAVANGNWRLCGRWGSCNSSLSCSISRCPTVGSPNAPERSVAGCTRWRVVVVIVGKWRHGTITCWLKNTSQSSEINKGTLKTCNPIRHIRHFDMSQYEMVTVNNKINTFCFRVLALCTLAPCHDLPGHFKRTEPLLMLLIFPLWQVNMSAVRKAYWASHSTHTHTLRINIEK